MKTLARFASSLYGAAWELRRRGHALGVLHRRRVPARVVSVGNLSVGGTGKTTLTIHLARCALARGWNVAVVCLDYRPGPDGRGDEALLSEAALGKERVFSGRRKVDLAERAAAQGHDLVLVDDGFSHWRLERDRDVVLFDARDPWGGGALLPAGRLREPRRALQRADVVVVSRVEGAEQASRLLAQIGPYAPAALRAAGRHRVTGVRGAGGEAIPAQGPARVVTATGNPAAVEESAREAGFAPVALSAYRDHHWFRRDEAERERAAADADGATLLLTAKDAVRWPLPRDGSAVLEVEWEWVLGGSEVEDLVLGRTGREKERA
jgi:tetraacyldisaccharide 4'-kinase